MSLADLARQDAQSLQERAPLGAPAAATSSGVGSADAAAAPARRGGAPGADRGDAAVAASAPSPAVSGVGAAAAVPPAVRGVPADRRGRKRRRKEVAVAAPVKHEPENGSEDEPVLVQQPPQTSSTSSWADVGGCEEAVRALREAVVLPLVYPHVLAGLSVPPPRGVLLYGPPGTGKTLCARVLADTEYTTAQGTQRVTFFSRSGAEVLSKWLGEGERKLRKMFEEAQQKAPSIIFFDEVDGLAPARSSGADHNHTSLVTVLLGLMDGLSSRGDVVVLGATNRVDAVDPALRRPGRFDREVRFVAPDLAGRRELLRIFTRGWNPPARPVVLDDVAARSAGYVGADLRGVCSEAVVLACRRVNPALLSGDGSSAPRAVRAADVTADDWSAALSKVVPCALRPARQVARPLLTRLVPLLALALHQAAQVVQVLLPEGLSPAVDSGGVVVAQLRGQALLERHRRLLLCGAAGCGQTHVALALLARMPDCAVHVLDPVSVYASAGGASPAQRVATILDAARASTPSVLYVPQVDQWSGNDAACLWAALDDVPLAHRLLVLATVDEPWMELSTQLTCSFAQHVCLQEPSTSRRANFFAPLLQGVCGVPVQGKGAREDLLKQHCAWYVACGEALDGLLALTADWSVDQLDRLYTDLSDKVNALPADVTYQHAFAHLRRAAMRLGESRARVSGSRSVLPAAVSNESSGAGPSVPAGQPTAAAASDPPAAA